VTGEFTRWGGQLLQLAGVHTEQWGYFKLIHLEGTPLTRIDGMMIIGMFGGCFAAALWANNIKLRLPRSRIRIIQAVAGGIIAGLAHAWRWAATWQPFLPVFLSFPSTPGSLPSRQLSEPGLARALRYCPCSVFRSNTKVSAASPLTQKPAQARRRFRAGCWCSSP
jgi:hypothetical protein